MIGAKDVGAEKAKQQGVKRVSEWLVSLLPPEEREEDDGGTAEDGKETSVIVNQLACMEEGCPDVEVVITLLRCKPRPKLMFKIYKAAKDLSLEEVASAMRKAEAEERGEAVPTHGHGHDEHKGDNHGHGHDEHGHGHDEKKGGDGCHDGCCGHDHHDGAHDHGHDDSKKPKHDHDHA